MKIGYWLVESAATKTVSRIELYCFIRHNSSIISSTSIERFVILRSNLTHSGREDELLKCASLGPPYASLFIVNTVMMYVTSHTPVEDTMNPDPGSLWVVSWVHCSDDVAQNLQTSLNEMTTVPSLMVMFRGTTWIARDVVVEEGVVGQPNIFRIRFKEAAKLI